jgi:hypothetical protein
MPRKQNLTQDLLTTEEKDKEKLVDETEPARSFKTF